MSLTFLVCLFVCLSQFLAAVCKGPDPLHLHVLCRRCGRDRSLGRGRQQDSGSTGPHDERILDGMQNYSHPPVCYSIVFNTHIMKYTCVCVVLRLLEWPLRRWSVPGCWSGPSPTSTVPFLNTWPGCCMQVITLTTFIYFTSHPEPLILLYIKGLSQRSDTGSLGVLRFEPVTFPSVVHHLNPRATPALYNLVTEMFWVKNGVSEVTRGPTSCFNVELQEEKEKKSVYCEFMSNCVVHT